MNIVKKIAFIYLFQTFSISCFSQITFPVNGIRNPEKSLYLIQHINLVPEPGKELLDVSILIENGYIKEIGPNINSPKHAVAMDGEGRYMYAAFIEPLSNFGVKELKKIGVNEPTSSKKVGAFTWNESLKPELSATDLFIYNESEAKTWRQGGFGAINTHFADGISRGSSTIVLLADKNEHELIIKDQAANILSFQKGTTSQDYPNSLMGVIALLRQTYYDAQYYNVGGKNEEFNISLDSWNKKQALTQIIIVQNKFEVLSAARLGKEFSKEFIVKGEGDEYQRAEEIKNSGRRLIIPLDFPPLYNIDDPFDALQIDLADLKHFELAPSNASILEKKSIPFIFTAEGLKDPSNYLVQIRKAVARGLSKERALYAMSLGPAEWLGIDDKLGSLTVGKMANFIVTDGLLFEAKTKILECWTKGIQHVFEPINKNIGKGNYLLNIQDSIYRVSFNIQEKINHIEVYGSDSTKHKLTLDFSGEYVQGKFVRKQSGEYTLLSGTRSNNTISGEALLENGKWSKWRMTPDSSLGLQLKSAVKQENKSEENQDTVGTVIYPFMAYGWKEKPTKLNYLIKNVTVWTCEKEGKLKGIDVLIKNGKIDRIGKNISVKGIEIIDGTHKHLTPGIIDEHSHIAIWKGVNECSQASTAEVRIGDVITSDDINIYRQLAGGVTTAQLLHGSCNPIGGQSALIKLRWGLSPEEMKFEGADPFIKFALGENVKRSNGNQKGRYPNTRMGVEQIYIDAFTRAKDYDIKSKTGVAFRRDLELETLAEIINKKRFITCHSYVQSEINMLMHVAEKFNFKINTFTHILEGYKVADKMAKHGAAASSFSDWWAYKFEVYEAIPYNGAILHEQGVVTAFNSDNPEMACRLNQEAAKAVKYGGVSEEEALKFVTLNPAKMLHIDHQVGSIKEGKDADVVLWSDHPLSVYAMAEMTFVDGVKYFDRQEDMLKRKEIADERNRIIQKMIKQKSTGAGAMPFVSKPQRMYHCDSEGE
ncbi:MAG: amidohydrolase family protein [Bacteroidota bacterium]|nr:amidohydrolase family protein [Bacteroidota bacterium]